MMELHSAMSSIVGFMSLAKTAIDARDWAKLTDLSTKFNDQIIKAQQSVIDAQGAQSDCIAQLRKATEKIAELEAALAEQTRHRLEEFAPGKFALRVDLVAQDERTLGLDSRSQTKHYACQRCFAVTGKSIILQYYPDTMHTNAYYTCPLCQGSLDAK